MEEPETVCECVEDGTYCVAHTCQSSSYETWEREAPTCPGLTCEPVFLHCSCT